MSADRYPADAPSYVDLFTARMRVLKLEEALRNVRRMAIPAGAAFARRSPSGAKMCSDVLDIIDDALAEELDEPRGLSAAEPSSNGEGVTS